MSTSNAFAFQRATDSANEATLLRSTFNRFLQRLAGPTLVQVVSCTNAGGVSAQGSVDVQPLVNQVNGKGQPTPHGVVHKLVYMRVMGGSNAIIMDPDEGDIGLACFCSRDISAVKAKKGQANPGSARMYDWADGAYLGSVLGGVPQQYFRFTAGGIFGVSPTEINFQAPKITLNATDTLNMSATNAANLQSPANTISGGGTSIDGKPFLPHEHINGGGTGNSGEVA